MNFDELAENLGLEKDEFMELVDLFVETATPQLVQLKAAVEQRNEKEIRRIAHSIKGASGNLGLVVIFELAKKIEDQCQAQDFEEIQNLLKSLADLVRKLDSQRS